MIAGLGYFAYKKFGKPDNRKVILKYLDATFGGDHSSFVTNAEQGYIDSWADALMKGETTFIFNGDTYMTNGGKKRK